MIDCGLATHKLVKAGLWPARIDHLFFAHHHFDHIADYRCSPLCWSDQSAGQENRLRVWGPPPAELLTRRLMGPRGVFAHE